MKIGDGATTWNSLTSSTIAYASGIPYGECDSTSTSTAFTATVPGITMLTDGVCVMLKNGIVTSASGFTININGLGAKPVYSNMATGNDITPTDPTRDTTIFNINYTMFLVYSSTIVSDGGWICYRGYDANTNTIGYQLRTNSTPRTAADKGYRYRLWFTSLDGQKWVPSNTSSSTNATSARTPNTRVIDPFGDIVYCATNGTIEANETLSATNSWSQYTITFGYAFNNKGATLTLTNPAPVYIKCTPQTGGGVVMNDYVQTLPSTEDGYVYLFIGMAYSETAVELFPNHPVYYYKDGAIRLWTNAPEAEIPSSTMSATTGISIADHPTASIYGVGSSTVSVTGVQSSTTTASKVTLGTAISVPNVTAATDVTVPIKNTSATTVPIKNTSATTIPNVTAVGSGSYTQGSFSGGSLTMAMDTTDTKKLKITFTPATHGSDSHTHIPPTLGTDISIIGVQSSTTSVTGVQSSTTTASKVTLGTAISVPNVTDASDVTVPIKATSATSVPVKESESTTVVVGGTHNITDPKHSHYITNPNPQSI